MQEYFFGSILQFLKQKSLQQFLSTPSICSGICQRVVINIVTYWAEICKDKIIWIRQRLKHEWFIGAFLALKSLRISPFRKARIIRMNVNSTNVTPLQYLLNSVSDRPIETINLLNLSSFLEKVRYPRNAQRGKLEKKFIYNGTYVCVTLVTSISTGAWLGFPVVSYVSCDLVSA